MKTIVEKIQSKCDVIARRHKSDVDFITVFTPDDKAEPDYGRIVIEIYEFGGVKWKDGRAVGDHDSFYTVCDLEKYAKSLGVKLEQKYIGNDSDNHRIIGFWLIFDETIKND